VIDALDQLLAAGEGTAVAGLVSDQGEEALDLIQPSAVGGNAAGSDRLRANDCNCDRSSSLSTSSAFGSAHSHRDVSVSRTPQ
jgi:hypothetical protein